MKYLQLFQKSIFILFKVPFSSLQVSFIYASMEKFHNLGFNNPFPLRENFFKVLLFKKLLFLKNRLKIRNF
jgi:hypothetical protein